ncbi:MAG: sigma 54-interacting transcriptional regulator [Clostridium sp.]
MSRGAFTGANKGGKIGSFELYHGSTLFLDEISEVSINVQSKLLRVLQEREVRRIGDDKVISVDVRLICATNQNLKKLIVEGRFRQDLLYRLDVLRVFLPPLRRREKDVLLIFSSLLSTLSAGQCRRTSTAYSGSTRTASLYSVSRKCPGAQKCCRTCQCTS